MDDPSEIEAADVVIVGAGAAGLMASVFAGREAKRLGSARRIVALDGAKKIGIKILVAGGGRCNVTHHAITGAEYAGTSANAIKNVLKRFGVRDTVAFFEELGVHLKREDTGKLFPTTDDAHTVLNALLGAVRDAGAELRFPRRVERIEKTDAGFVMSGEWGSIAAPRVILSTGGKALPKSGSDGAGYALARGLGHMLTDHVFPALVPLVLEPSSIVRSLSGVTLPATVELRSGTNKRLKRFTNSTLCTHFGLSGPAVMDLSRYYTAARTDDPGAHVVMGWLPDADASAFEQELLELGKRSVGRHLRERLPERVVLALLNHAGVPPDTPGASLTKDARRAIVGAVFEMRLPVTGDRGYTHAEVTAGGVPLTEVNLKTMESRVCPGLHLCGEILDADGRIGGFNFQWAWATGSIAGANAV